MSNTSFVLHSVAVENYKTFAEATFSPLREGLTGVSGSNGAGKSSIVDAILYALYGFTPKDVKIASLRRRQSDPKTDATKVTVTFSHAGQIVEVTRQIRGKNNTVTASIFVDGQEATVATGSTAEQWVTSRLGMNADGFRTAIVIPQKELDKLVDEVPSARRARIEKLAGIEDMNLAVKNARSQENSLRSHITGMPGDEEEFANLSENISFTELALNEAKQKTLTHEKTSHEASKAAADGEGDVKTLRTSVRQIQSKVDDIRQYEANIALVTEKIRAKEETLQNFSTRFGSLEPQDASQLSDKVALLSANLQELRPKVSRQQVDRENLLAQVSSLQGDTEAKQKELSLRAEALQSLRERQEKLPSHEELEKGLQASRKALTDHDTQSALLIDARDGLSEAIATLSHSSNASHDKAQCPTCHSRLDDPSSLIREFEDKKEKLSLSIEDLSAKRKTLLADINLTEGNLTTFTLGQTSLKDAVQAEEEAQQQLSTVEALFAETKQRLSSISISAIKKAEKKVGELEQELTVAQQASSLAKEAEQAIQHIEATQAEVASLREEKSGIEELLSEAYNLLGEQDNLEMAQQELADAEENLLYTRQAAQNASSLLISVQREQTRLEYDLESLGKEYQRLDSALESKRKMLALLADKAAVSDVLDEYRKERIAKIAPELSGTATDLISAMTEGKFLEVRVKEDFSTEVVTDDDLIFAVSELSGGEKSIVALALRIAIGALITGENAGLLWLDEALPAQDRARRDAIMGVLRSLPIQQIVMINHTYEANDVVDKVLYVANSTEGSVITEVS